MPSLRNQPAAEPETPETEPAAAERPDADPEPAPPSPPTIENALAGLTVEGQAIPAAAVRYDGRAPSYVVYTLLGQVGEIYAEAAEAATGVSFAIDCYSPGRSSALMLAVKAALEAAGWIVTVEMEHYDHSVDRFQSSLTASIEGALYG